MKAYWFYQCDFGHSWVLFKEENAEEKSMEAICPFGHEAVTLQKRLMINSVQISARSARQIIDSVTGRISFDNKYYLVLTDLNKEVERMSINVYLWEEIKILFDMFVNISPEKAWHVLDEFEKTE